MIELYDHATDPAEMINLARDPDRAGLIRELEQQLRERVAAAETVPAGLKVLEAVPRGKEQRTKSGE
ncbi:MAG: hypothetical protein HC901_01685 [Bdellovibrionaceae bacterium]|nr:hypothetical protein [Pseudobdellovibrionaceae bacterium]